MSIYGDGFYADPDELRGGASDILRCLNPAKGADFEALNGDFDDSDQGDKILAGKFETFCNTWDVAYLVLGDRAGDMSGKLKKQAYEYEQADAHAEQYMHRNGSGL
ncbi:hypothetical protein [Streptomyces lydicamycinicus]|uniref:hypothetical protein n=1 Tax=Streptomyces lydicamycinicus TaxID=1546107 RepID=UPI003C2AC998